MFPPTRKNEEVWRKIRIIEKKEMDDYISRIKNVRRKQRCKKRRFDEVDIMNNIEIIGTKSEKITTSRSNDTANEAPVNAYWLSNSARDLFNLAKDESVTA